MKEETGAMGLFGVWWVWIALLVLVTVSVFTYARYASLPFLRNMETTGIRESNEFVQTKLALLQKLDSDCARLQAEVTALRQQPGNEDLVTAKRAQMRALGDQMRSERSYLPVDRQSVIQGCAA